MGLPWSHAYAENRHEGCSSDDVLDATVRSMGHALEALAARWPQGFPGGAKG